METNIISNAESVQVSVLMITYNHEKFIEKAIQAVLAQKTNFAVQLLICNDASTDQTAEIVESCILRNSSSITIKYEHHHQNIGVMPNFKKGLELCTGKYIALCDGDDYWTDPLKLQKQADFLEANEDYAICFSGYKIANQIIGQETLVDNIGGSITIEQIINSNSYSTATALFVSKYLHPLPSWFDKIKFGDWGLYLNTLFTSKKKAYCLPDVTTVYRIHKGGIHGNLHASNSTLANAYKMHIDFYRQMQTYLFRDEYIAQIKDCIKARKGIIARLLKEEKKYLAAIISKWY